MGKQPKRSEPRAIITLYTRLREKEYWRKISAVKTGSLNRLILEAVREKYPMPEDFKVRGSDFEGVK